jgi:hypothetical protein
MNMCAVISVTLYHFGTEIRSIIDVRACNADQWPTSSLDLVPQYPTPNSGAMVALRCVALR